MNTLMDAVNKHKDWCKSLSKTFLYVSRIVQIIVQNKVQFPSFTFCFNNLWKKINAIGKRACFHVRR